MLILHVFSLTSEPSQCSTAPTTQHDSQAVQLVCSACLPDSHTFGWEVEGQNENSAGHVNANNDGTERS